MYRTAFLSIVAVGLFAGVAAAEPSIIRHPGGLTGRYIVVMKGAPPDTVSINAIAETHAAIDRLAATHNAMVEHRYTAVLRGFSAELTDADAERLAADPDVAYVEQDTPVYATAIQENATWGLDRIDQAALPLDARYVQLGDGEGTTVYVIDTGIRTTHSEFTGRMQAGAFAVQDGNGVEDCNGHGSHVAGTIAGTTFGVAKRANVVPVRVLDCAGSGSAANVIAGMDFVRQNAKPNSVANMSLGGPANDAEDTAARNLVAAGVTLVVAAGNDNQDACLQSPARERTAITVGASTEIDARASFSNFGTCVDVFAPGTGIVSAAIASDTATASLNGTSMASPHVAGVAAAYLSANPGATPAAITTALLAGATRDKVTDSKGSPNLLLNTAFVDSLAPVTTILSPANGAQVPAQFVVDADGSDKNLDRVELTVDGTLAGSKQSGPFRFEVSGLAQGTHTLVVTAFDLAGKSSTQSVTVTVTSGGGDGDGDGDGDGELTGGCTTGGLVGGGALPLALAALAFTTRRRRR